MDKESFINIKVSKDVENEIKFLYNKINLYFFSCAVVNKKFI